MIMISQKKYQTSICDRMTYFSDNYELFKLNSFLVLLKLEKR